MSMRCRQAYDLDLAAYLAAPRDPTWDAFRAHYPTCADCSAELAAWTALETSLASAHPDPALLLRWSDDPQALELAERARLARHLERCASCRDELRALGSFELEAEGASAPHAEAGQRRVATAAPAAASLSSAPPGPPAEREPATRQPLRGIVRRVLWSPALPYAALLALLLYPLVRSQLGSAPEPLAVRAPAVLGEPQQPAALSAPASDLGGASGTSRDSGGDAAKRDGGDAEPPAKGLAVREQRLAAESSPAVAVAIEPARDARAENEVRHSEPSRKASIPSAPPAPAPPAPRLSAPPAEVVLAAPARPAAPPPARVRSPRAAQPAAPLDSQPALAPHEPDPATAARAFAAARSAPSQGGDREPHPARPGEGDSSSMRAALADLASPSGRIAGLQAQEKEPGEGSLSARLVIDLPQAAGAAETLEVRIRDASGSREARETVQVVEGQRTIVLEVPAAWLGGSNCTVEVHSESTGLLLRRSMTVP